MTIEHSGVVLPTSIEVGRQMIHDKTIWIIIHDKTIWTIIHDKTIWTIIHQLTIFGITIR
jgi:hypothetical protein